MIYKNIRLNKADRDLTKYISSDETRRLKTFR